MDGHKPRKGSTMTTVQRAMQAMEAAGFGKREYRICWQTQQASRSGQGYPVKVFAPVARLIEATPTLVAGGMQVTHYAIRGQVQTVSLRAPRPGQPGKLEVRSL